MHFSTIISVTALLGIRAVQANVPVKRAVIDGPCTGEGGAPGVCIATAECTSAGGKYISDACPGTPNDIKCCSKTSCGSGGNCRWTNQCSGSTTANLCPGPASFMCCNSASFPPPKIPAVGACKQTAVDGAKDTVAAHEGKIREIFCTRDCACPGTSDHCCGMAIDFMCSSGGGVRTEAGKPIAEWVMRNAAAQNVKYVIWGQKIWESGEAVRDWAQWQQMEDRGSITANHWDHVHVSYRS